MKTLLKRLVCLIRGHDLYGSVGHAVCARCGAQGSCYGQFIPDSSSK